MVNLRTRMVPTCTTVEVHKVYGGHITTHSKWPGDPFTIVNYPGDQVQGGGLLWHTGHGEYYRRESSTVDIGDVLSVLKLLS